MPGFIGLPEIMLLALVALIVFGPKRLPEMGRGLGKGMREFKESVTGDHNHQVIVPSPEADPVALHLEQDQRVEHDHSERVA